MPLHGAECVGALLKALPLLVLPPLPLLLLVLLHHVMPIAVY